VVGPNIKGNLEEIWAFATRYLRSQHVSAPLGFNVPSFDGYSNNNNTNIVEHVIMIITIMIIMVTIKIM
jgi:hypothetical protein